jgi:uncharacterized protein (DUF302 family)
MTLDSADIISVQSPFSVQETLLRFKAFFEEKGLTLFADIDHAAGAKKVGLTMNEAHLLIFGHPKAGTPLMVARPLLALDLPLRILIWEKADQTSWVSYNSTDFLARRHEIPSDLVKNIAVIDSLVSAVLSS